MRKAALEYMKLVAQAGVGREPLALPKPGSPGNYHTAEYTKALQARNIILARLAVGLNQEDLARRAGIRPESLNRIEKGRTMPHRSTMAKLERALRTYKPKP